MMSPLVQAEFFLTQKDYYFLSDVFSREIEAMLPVRGTVIFWGPAWSKGEEKEWFHGKKIEKQLGSRLASLKPGIVKDRLILPLHVDSGDNVAAVVQGIDPALLGKMADEWLREFREAVQARLEKVRKTFVDPVTGLYTTGLLLDWIDRYRQEEANNILFLICAKRKSRRVTKQLPQTVQIGRFIDATTPAPLFYLGGDVFAQLQDKLTRREALKTAHHLLQRLKRKGVQSAHVGISILDEVKQQKDAAAVLQECWQAMEVAERRGPFSLCEGSYLADTESHPFALPEQQVVADVRRKWRGTKQFGMIRLRADKPAAGTLSKGELDMQITALLPEGASYVSLSSKEGYIFIPGIPAKKVQQLGNKMKKKMELDQPSLSVSLGITHWPMLGFSKTQTLVNCRKALMHGGFFGSGSVTVFDHVSLNVSGDYFYDEGDYRQAVRDYRIGVQLAPDDMNLLNSLGVALTALNRHREAVVCFDRVLVLDSGNFMAQVNMGFAQRILGNDTQAVDYLARASQHKDFKGSSTFEEVSLQLARLYCDQERYGRALELLTVLERKKSGRQEYSLLLLLGEAYAETGQYKKAIGFLQQAVCINPHDAHALSLLGEQYALDGQGDEIALSLCGKAVALDDTSWKNWYRLASVQLRAGLAGEARTAVRESLRLKRNVGEVIRLAEQIYLHLGETNKARSMRNRLLKIFRTDKNDVKAMLN